MNKQNKQTNWLLTNEQNFATTQNTKQHTKHLLVRRNHKALTKYLKSKYTTTKTSPLTLPRILSYNCVVYIEHKNELRGIHWTEEWSSTWAYTIVKPESLSLELHTEADFVENTSTSTLRRINLIQGRRKCNTERLLFSLRLLFALYYQRKIVIRPVLSTETKSR